MKRLAKSWVPRRSGSGLEFEETGLLPSSQLRNKLQHARKVLKDFERRVMLVEAERDEISRELASLESEVRALLITGDEDAARKLVGKIEVLKLRLDDVEARLKIVRTSRDRMQQTCDSLAGRVGIEDSL